MVRIFGLLVALSALTASANAALLRYDFNNSLAPNTPPAYITPAGNFNLGTAGGSTTATALQTAGTTSAGTQNSFSGTYTGNQQLVISQIQVRHARAASPSPTMTVSYQVDSGPLVYVADFNPASSFQTYSTDDNLIPFQSVTLNPGQTFRVQFDYVSAGATGPAVLLDWAEFNGAEVPEPASIAVFGSLAAFGLVRRFRRK